MQWRGWGGRGEAPNIINILDYIFKVKQSYRINKFYARGISLFPVDS